MILQFFFFDFFVLFCLYVARFFLVIMNYPFSIISVVFWRIFRMDGMHEAKGEGVLIAQHQCAWSCKNKGVFMQKQGSLHAKNKGVFMQKQGNLHAKNRGVFMPKQGTSHSFGNVQNESLSQFALSCEILAWLCENDKGSAKFFNPLDYFA